MSKLSRERATARRKSIEDAIYKWRYQHTRLVAEFYTKRKAEIERITAELNKQYDPPEMACWQREKAARAALQKLQEKDCPKVPHRGMHWCDICGWNRDR